MGGTWYENRYPGCACDVPAHLYSFSFERNPDWTRMFAGQQEIWQYLKSCVQRYGLALYILFGTRFCEAAWDEKAGCWRISTNQVSSGNGNRSDSLIIRARVLISGMGALHVPHYPEIPGTERFSGPSFHSATWRSDVDLTGKTVAVVGTGASAIQFIPHLAPRGGKLYIFQRTPPWIVPRLDFGFSEKAPAIPPTARAHLGISQIPFLCPRMARPEFPWRSRRPRVLGANRAAAPGEKCL